MRTRWIHLAPLTPLALAAGLSAACGPPPTGSASVSADGALLFTAASGKANNVIVTTDGSAVVLADGGDDITAAAGCAQRTRNSVRCPGVTTLEVILGDGDDRFLNGSSLGTEFPGVAGGPGDDVLHGGDGPERIQGDEGADDLHGGAGADLLADGQAAASSDAIDADVFDGGDGGGDTVTYQAASRPVTIDLDGGADDGQAGEGDHIQGTVEALIGGAGGDVVTGSNGNNFQLKGEGGNDLIRGLGGHDDLRGGSGGDGLDGGAGDDACDAGTTAGDFETGCER